MEVINVLVFPILLLFVLTLFGVVLAVLAALQPAPQRVRRPRDE